MVKCLFDSVGWLMSPPRKWRASPYAFWTADGDEDAAPLSVTARGTPADSVKGLNAFELLVLPTSSDTFGRALVETWLVKGGRGDRYGDAADDESPDVLGRGDGSEICSDGSFCLASSETAPLPGLAGATGLRLMRWSRGGTLGPHGERCN